MWKGFKMNGTKWCKYRLLENNNDYATVRTMYDSYLAKFDFVIYGSFDRKVRKVSQKIREAQLPKVVIDGLSRVLIIGDLHEPFCLDGYLEHCKDVYTQYACTSVLFVGDIIDNHFSGYHESDPDGLCAGHELELAIKKIHKWYKAFPSAKVILGNHDLIIARKAYSGGVANQWIRSYGEVLKTPNWKFAEEFIIDGVTYCHGTGSKARNRAKRELCSVVQGHYHSESYIEYTVGNKFKIFAMQVGCGVDRKSYAMAYGKHFAKPAIGCGVVIDGIRPYIEMMEL